MTILYMIVIIVLALLGLLLAAKALVLALGGAASPELLQDFQTTDLVTLVVLTCMAIVAWWFDDALFAGLSTLVALLAASCAGLCAWRLDRQGKGRLM